MCFQEIGWEDMDLINLPKDWDTYRAVANTVTSRVA